jgi:SAM-dependent MidA family methyltransferase
MTIALDALPIEQFRQRLQQLKQKYSQTNDKSFVTDTISADNPIQHSNKQKNEWADWDDLN